MRLTIGFQLNSMSIRGTEVAVYDYADYNEILLNNRSIIFVPSNYRSHRHPNTGLTFDTNIDRKFRERFLIVEYNNPQELDEHLGKYKCDLLYILKSGEKDNLLPKVVPSIIHCVFTCTETNKHGDVYAAISQSINRCNAEVVPHICKQMPDVQTSLLIDLGIPSNTAVVGCYGGYEVFDLEFVQKAVQDVVHMRKDIHFIFMGIKQFCENTDRIHFLPANSDEIYKARFIKTCTAMLHGRSIGESFGLSIAEFTTLDKPIITWKHVGERHTYEDTHHLDTLADTGIYYRDYDTLISILRELPRENLIKPINYAEIFTPLRVMKEFEEKLILPAIKHKKWKIRVLCNWAKSRQLYESWNKLITDLPLVFVEKDEDYTVIVNAPQENDEYDPSKTIVFGMEPDTFTGFRWQWYNDRRKFLYFQDQSTMNNLEWWLSKSRTELLSYIPEKTMNNRTSSIVSSQCIYPGHKLRINFLKQAEKVLNLDIYGWDNKHDFQSYRGKLENCKDDGLFPYKYTIAAENTSRDNYFTEKLVDAILAETLCFYWGCRNLTDFLDPLCFIWVDMENVEKGIQTIQKAIQNNEWERRIMVIREMKMRILTKLSFGPRLIGLLQLLDLPKRTINLDTRPDKWVEHMNRCRVAHVHNVERFNAVKGSDYNLQSEYIQNNFILTVNFVGPGRNPNGIIGCCLSHKALYEQVVKSGKPMLIFEDDITFAPQFADRMGYLLNQIADMGDSVELVFIGWHDHETNSDYHNLTRTHLQDNFSKQDLVSHKYMLRFGSPSDASGLHGGGTHGYYITPKGAERYLSTVKDTKIYFPADFMLLETLLHFGMKGYICPHKLVLGPKFGVDTMDSDVQIKNTG